MKDKYIGVLQARMYLSEMSMQYTRKALGVKEEEPLEQYRKEAEYLNRANEIVRVADILDDIPEADVEERKQGAWQCIRYSDNDAEGIFIKCPYCHREYNVKKMFELLGNYQTFNRCPECGLLATNEVFEVSDFYFKKGKTNE